MAGLLPWLMPAAPAQAACQLTTVARMQTTSHEGLPVVQIDIADVTVPLIVDTGATVTVIATATAEALRLQRDPMHRHQVVALGDFEQTARWEDDLLGNVRIGPDFYPNVTIHASSALDDGSGHAIGGVLGTDMLSRYDVEIDMQAATLTLYHAPGCTGDYVPWSGPHRMLPALREAGTTGRLGVPLRVMGTPVNNIIDTGAQASIITRSAAVNVGVPDSVLLGGTPETAVGGTGGRIPSRRLRFPSIDIGGETYENVPLTVADTHMGGIEMLLGQDWIGSRRIWLSYDNGTVFVSGP